MARSSIHDILQEARSLLVRLSPEDAHSVVRDGSGTLVDIRTSDSQLRQGRLPGAIEISLNVLEWRLDPDSEHRHPDGPDLDDLVVVICEQGYSSSLAAVRLQQLGFARATDVIGGFEAWTADGLPVQRAPSAISH